MEEGRESWRKKIQGKGLLLPARFPRPDLRSPPTIKILLRERTSFSCNPHPPPSSIVAPFPRFFVPFRFVSFLCALSFSPRRQSDALCRGQNTTFCRICKKRKSQTVVISLQPSPSVGFRPVRIQHPPWKSKELCRGFLVPCRLFRFFSMSLAKDINGHSRSCMAVARGCCDVVISVLGD